MSAETNDKPAKDDPVAEATEQAVDNAVDEAASRIAALEVEIADLKDRLLRAVAEMDNLRKRTQREKEDAARYAITKFARDLVSVADDLSRALGTVTPEARAEAGDFAKTLIDGVEMTERRLQQVFSNHGLTRFDPAGEKFDPTVHEAMFEVPDPSQPAGTVAHVAEAGYMIGDRVLRPARVGVSAGGPKQPSAAAAASSASDTDPAGAEPSPENETEEAEGEPQRVGLKVDRTA